MPEVLVRSVLVGIIQGPRPIEAADKDVPIETLDVDALEPLVRGCDEAAHALGPELGGVVSVRPHLAGRDGDQAPKLLAGGETPAELPGELAEYWTATEAVTR